MKNLRYILLSAVALVTLAGCDKWIDNAKTPSNSLTYDDLRRPGMMASVKGKILTDGALTANVKTLAGQASSAAFMALGAMTDELTPTKVPNALVYKALSDDNASSAGGEADGVFNNLQNLRARAEELMLQVHNNGKVIVFTGSREDAEKHTQAMHVWGLLATFEKVEN